MSERIDLSALKEFVTDYPHWVGEAAVRCEDVLALVEAVEAAHAGLAALVDEVDHYATPDEAPASTRKAIVRLEETLSRFSFISGGDR